MRARFSFSAWSFTATYSVAYSGCREKEKERERERERPHASILPARDETKGKLTSAQWFSLSLSFPPSILSSFGSVLKVPVARPSAGLQFFVQDAWNTVEVKLEVEIRFPRKVAFLLLRRERCKNWNLVFQWLEQKKV